MYDSKAIEQTYTLHTEVCVALRRPLQKRNVLSYVGERKNERAVKRLVVFIENRNKQMRKRKQ